MLMTTINLISYKNMRLHELLQPGRNKKFSVRIVNKKIENGCSLTSKDLVEEDLDVVGTEMLRTDDDLVEIAL